MKAKLSIQNRLYLVIGSLIAFVAVVMISVLILLQGYNQHYSRLLYNITTASEFNQEFKNNIDQKMYYYVIESRYSEGLPVDEVKAAQALAQDLLVSTTEKNSHQSIASVLDLCQTLEDKIYQIEACPDYDDRMTQLENNIYVLSSLIEEYMYSYLYHEAVNLNELQQAIQRQIYTEIVAVSILTLVLTAAALIYSFRLSRSISKPLKELYSRALDVSAGDLSVREPIESDAYELRTLSEGMEYMIERLNEQMQQVQQKQESLRRTELALLQAQINPHFLYNTMDTIMWLVEAGSSQEAVEMLSDLSSFFRHSLSRGQDVISLAEEEQHVRSYLQIQHVRYKDILSYTLDIDPALHHVSIPKLTLQPLVENALYHGIKLRRVKGLIEIKGWREGDCIFLQVKDNGIGMSPQRLEELRATAADTKQLGFGFSAVNQRLQLQFGPEYGLHVESEQGVGTVVTARIPYPDKEMDIT